MKHDRIRKSRASESGFTLVEMIVVTMLLLVAMLGLLAVFDASARINKNESDVADAQGAVRYGLYQMTRVVRMAGAGGLFVTQAVLNHADVGLPGLNGAAAGFSYDNVTGVSIANVDTGTNVEVRDGTDMIEVRGVILSPLLGFDLQTGCGGCVGVQTLTARPIVGDPLIGQHVNDDPQRPQFAAIDAYTAGASPAQPMFVIVEDGNTDLHSGCSDPNPGGVTRYPQPVYNVGTITAGTSLVSSQSFNAVNFDDLLSPRFNVELPSYSTGQNSQVIQKVRRAGVMDDIIFFIGIDRTTDPQGIHPFLGQGIRRGRAFQITRLAEDVEDMQVAYGIDGLVSAGGLVDNAITRTTPVVPPNDTDPQYSITADKDEWVPNVVGEAPVDDAQFQAQDPFINGHPGAPPPNHCPRLHAVMVSLLAKSKDPDPTYRGPAAKGFQIMNSTATPITPGNYRRRVQTIRINLRNYAFQG